MRRVRPMMPIDNVCFYRFRRKDKSCVAFVAREIAASHSGGGRVPLLTSGTRTMAMDR